MASVCTFYVNRRTYERPLQSRSSPSGRSGRGRLNQIIRSLQRDVLSWRDDLAKLNPKCHINYSIIFTKNSLSRNFKFGPILQWGGGGLCFKHLNTEFH